MDKNCGTCRFWLRQYDGDEDDWRVCDRARSSRDDESRGRMYVTAADDYDLALYTAPDFGCTEWAAIGGGIPIRISRFGRLYRADLRREGEELKDFHTYRRVAPEYQPGFSGVVKRKVEPRLQDVHGYGGLPGFAGPVKVVTAAWISLDAIGEDAFERGWAEAIEEAERLLADAQATSYRSE